MDTEQIDKVARDVIQATKEPHEKSDLIISLASESVWFKEILLRIREIQQRG